MFGGRAETGQGQRALGILPLRLGRGNVVGIEAERGREGEGGSAAFRRRGRGSRRRRNHDGVGVEIGKEEETVVVLDENFLLALDLAALELHAVGAQLKKRSEWRE